MTVTEQILDIFAQFGAVFLGFLFGIFSLLLVTVTTTSKRSRKQITIAIGLLAFAIAASQGGFLAAGSLGTLFCVCIALVFFEKRP